MEELPHIKEMQKMVSNKVGLGLVLGISGLIILSFGVLNNQIWTTRGGIALTTLAIWMITWQ